MLTANSATDLINTAIDLINPALDINPASDI